MATITTSPYYLDSAARTAGEVMTINGGQLVIRTDTRWHATAPTSMTGTLGGNSVISATLGGEIYIDATKVRWMPITGGSGTCAIGTTITQGGVTGYFLGFWSSVTATPSTTIGATGFIKLREVNGGTFSAGALSGITATASGPDVVGWIEVVADQLANFSIPRLGKFTTRGDWFDLGVTTGVAGQVVLLPTNGSATTYTGGVWIESSIADDYDFYSAVYSTGFIAGNFSNDRRSRVVKMNTNGSIEIGTGGVGFTPPAGRKIRTSNIFLRQCVTATRAVNAIPHATVATRPDFTTTSAGYIDIENTNGDWYFSFSQPYYVKIKNTATHEGIAVSECATAMLIENGGAGTSAGLAGAGLLFTSCFAGGLIKDWVASGYSNAVTGGMMAFNYCSGQVVQNCKSGCWLYARSASKSYGYSTTYCDNITFTDCQSLNATNNLTTSTNITVTNFDYCDRYVGETNTTTGLYCWVVTSKCSNVKIDGITFGLQTTIPNVHPYSGIISCTSSSNCKFRNYGTRSLFLSGGTVTANQPGYIWVDGGNNSDIKVQRCYLQPTRTAAHSSQNSSKNMLFEDVYGDWLDTVTMAGLNTIERGGSGKMTVTGQASVYGTHFGGAYMSDTWGAMWLAMNEPSADTLQYTESNFSVGSGFTSAGGLSLATAGDWFSCAMQEYRLQTTGFVGATPWAIGTNPQYHDYDYQIDSGSGWSDWKQLTTCRLRSGGGTAGTNTFTIFAVAESRQPQIGDFVTAQLQTQFADGCYVTNIVGTTITLSSNILVTLATNLPVFFSNNLNYESVQPDIGYKLKFKVTAMIGNNTNLINYIQCNTNSTLEAQINNPYPLDTVTLSITGIVTGSDIVVLSAGTTTVLANVDSFNGTTYGFVYEIPEVVDICIYKRGYIPFFIRGFSLGSSDASVPTAQVADRNYKE